METLYIQLNPDNESAQWLVLDEKNQPHSAIRQGPVSSLKDFSKQRRIVCALNSSDIFLTEVTLPFSRNRRKLEQAVPYMLEDELAEDVEKLHFALGKAQEQILEDEEDEGDKRVNLPVAVINKNTLQDCLNILQEAGLKPHAILPDVLSVPIDEDEWTVMLNGNRALLRTGVTTGVACDLENLGMLLEFSLEQKGDAAPKQIHIWNHNETESELELQLEDVEVNTTQAELPWLNTLARGYGKTDQINLLQGEFSFRQEYGKMLKRWQLPAIFLGVLVVLMLGTKIFQFIQLEKEIKELDKQSTRVYKQVFPNSRNFTDMRHQFETKLKELGSAESANTDFLSILNAAGKHIVKNKTVKIEAITFNGQRLDIEMTAPAIAQMEEIKQALDAEELVTEISSISAEGDKVSGQLRISK